MEEGDDDLEYSDVTLEFRSRNDDAWHPVQLDIIGGLLFVSLVEVTQGRDREVFGVDAFHTLAELEGFRARFRPISTPVGDVDCNDIQEGMTVCVTHDISPDDWGCYDGVVNEVKRVEHVVDGDNEECHCNFQIYWKHGPLAGTTTSMRLQKIQLLVSDTKAHPALADFIDKVQERFKGPVKRLRFMLDKGRRRGNYSNRIASFKGPGPSKLCKMSPAWEEKIASSMPRMVTRAERTMPFDLPTLSPDIYGMQGIHGTGIEFRSMKDDAWHGVDARLTLNGKLALVYNDYTMFGMEETHEPDKFNTLGEIEDFQERFRPLSTHLIPGECGEVKVGDRVCVRLDLEESDDGKFYDSVVKEVGLFEDDLKVVRYEHAVLDDQETCFCNFDIFWKHGPLGSTITSANMDRICLITPTTEIQPALESFLDSARHEVMRPKKRHRMGEQDLNRDGVTLSRGQSSKKNDKGKDIVVDDR